MLLGERRRFRRSSYLYSRPVFINFCRLCWAILVVWAELGVFFWSVSFCSWPSHTGSSQRPTRMLLLSDPQVRLDSAGDGSTVSSSLGQFLFHLNLKKNWHVMNRLRPHIILFLGDMLANGKLLKDGAEYRQYVQKFKSIFTTPAALVYYLPGNNDIGMGISPTNSNIVRNNYQQEFGPLNQEHHVRNHTLLFLDAPGLVDEDYQRSAYGLRYEEWSALPGGTVSFVKGIANRDDEAKEPLLLFSHIPLSRPESASCGPLREKGTIRRGVGHGYQNTLGKQTTIFLLRSLRPSGVYSGDNRDYCEYVHTAKEKSGSRGEADVREVSIKSFSMANNIRYPGFQLLSLIDPGDRPETSQKSFVDTPCFLPDQYGIYTSIFMPLAVFNTIILLLLNIRRFQNEHRLRIDPLATSPQSSGSTTPIPPQPESAIWSPYTPIVPVSPRHTLPAHLRTPNANAGPTFRASRPATPVDSPLLAPVIYPPEDDEETMYPAQYVTRRDSYSPDESWQNNGHADRETPIPQFTSAPGWKAVPYRRGWSWSWTFVFRGRRRRMTLRLPLPSKSWTEMLGTTVMPSGKLVVHNRHTVIQSTLLDVLNVFWPSFLIWVLLIWWIYATY